MDNLPDHLIFEILNRLNDSTDLTRCKLVSKTLNTLAPRVPSIHLQCSRDRYIKMRSPETRSKMTPFKTIFNKLISEAQAPIQSVSLRVDESSIDPSSCDTDSSCDSDSDSSWEYDYDLSFLEKNDDLFLASDTFSENWMAKIGDGLKSISIGDFDVPSLLRKTISVEDFDVPSLLRKTDILPIISNHCRTLVELELKNVGSTFDGMHLMPLLTKLNLNKMPMYDHDLYELMECLPCLEVFNLIDSCEDTSPVIFHLNLKQLKWTLNNRPMNNTETITVYAPELTKLELECQNPDTVIINAPLASYIYLALKSCDEFKLKLGTLETLNLVSSDLFSILSNFPITTTVWNLTLDSPRCATRDETFKFSLSKVLKLFPNVTSLTLGSGVWSQQMAYPSAPLGKGLTAKNRMNGLKQFTLYFAHGDIDRALCFILYVARICANLSDIVLFTDRDVDLSAGISYVSSCMSQCSKVRWRRGTWKRGWNDCISNSIVSCTNAV